MDIRALIGDRERCELAAQPIVDLKRGLVVGYEALSRFRLEPYVAPDLVFAEAKRQGLVIREERELLRVKPQTALSVVTLRAMTRVERLRWDPIVCIDESGQFRGVVRVHRLVTALADGKNVTPLEDAN